MYSITIFPSKRYYFFDKNIFVLFQAGSKAICRISVHVLDKNDNSPVLINTSYKGLISEAAPIGSLVLLNDTLPMLIKAVDADSGSNGLLQYEIVEFSQSRMFHVVSNTGMFLQCNLLSTTSS